MQADLGAPPPPRRRPRDGRSTVMLMATTFVAAVAFVVAVVLVAGTFGVGHVGVISSVRGPLVSRVDRQLVDIDTELYGDEGRAAGTGMVLTPKGLVLTNNHVVQGSVEIEATDIGNGETYAARVVGYDEHRDLAVLQLQDASGLSTVDLGNSAPVAVGQRIVTIGNAGGVGGAPSADSGTVVGLNEAITVGDDIDGTTEHLAQLIQVAGDLRPGDSGGPMINGSGSVIGMDTAASTTFEFGPHPAGEGFAIEIDSIRPVLAKILAQRGSATIHVGQTAFIGVGISTNGSSVAGAPISEAFLGTPAAAVGLGANDVITALDGQSVASASALTAALVRFRPGDRVELSWVDAGGRHHSAEITLANGPVG
jgi:S1-C subfamily serine protease